MNSRIRMSAFALVASGLLLLGGVFAGPAVAAPITSVQGGPASFPSTQQAMPGTWSQSNPGTSDNYTSITCPHSLSCLATLRNSSLLARTSDGGALWTTVDTQKWGLGTAATVSCPSVSRCYAIGATEVGGAVALYTSTDFGLSWSAQSLPAGLTGSSDLTCPSDLSCFAATTGTWNIVATSDGGSTWAGQSAPFAPGTITCSSGTTCFAFDSSSGAVVSTSDGTTWSARTALPTPSVYVGAGASCPTPTFCVVVGAGTYNFPVIPTIPVLYVSHDGGISWQEPTFPIPAWPATQNRFGRLSSVSCPTATTCYFRGNHFDGPVDDATTDGGITWTGQDPVGGLPLTPGAADYAQAIACPAATDCFAVGNSGIAHYAPTIPTPLVAMASTPDHGGYWMAASDGTVFRYGNAGFFGSMSGQPLASPIVGIVGTADGKGYWLVAADGGIFAFGDAAFYGSTGAMALNAPVVGMASSTDGKGYWLVASDGGVFAFGDARFSGSMGGSPLNEPVVGMTSDLATGGYWLVAADGGVFSFDAPYLGSMGGTHLNQPVVGIASSSTRDGYRFVAADGGVFSFDLPFFGSMGGTPINRPMVGIALAGPTGYWTVAADGGIFAFGVAPFFGSPA